MNLAYTEISNEEADRIIKSANLKTLANLIVVGNFVAADELAHAILST